MPILATTIEIYSSLGKTLVAPASHT